MIKLDMQLCGYALSSCSCSIRGRTHTHSLDPFLTERKIRCPRLLSRLDVKTIVRSGAKILSGVSIARSTFFSGRDLSLIRARSAKYMGQRNEILHRYRGNDFSSLSINVYGFFLYFLAPSPIQSDTNCTCRST